MITKEKNIVLSINDDTVFKKKLNSKLHTKMPD